MAFRQPSLSVTGLQKKNKFLLLFHQCEASIGHYILTHVVKKKIIIWASIHLKIVSMNKPENHCFRDVLFKQVE